MDGRMDERASRMNPAGRVGDAAAGEYQNSADLPGGLFHGIPLTLGKYLSSREKIRRSVRGGKKGEEARPERDSSSDDFRGQKGASRFREITVYYLFKIYRIAGRAK